MSYKASNQVQRDHVFAIVDEVDSVLIDEARTPMILSEPVPIIRLLISNLMIGRAK